MAVFATSHEYTRDFLYRVDRNIMSLVVLTSGVAMDIRCAKREISPLVDGETFRYELDFSPMVTNKNKKVPVRGERIKTWLEERFERNGIQPLNTIIHYNRGIDFDDGKKRFIINATTASGTATITDSHAANLLFRNGVGKHRTYGYGLLNIKDRHNG